MENTKSGHRTVAGRRRQAGIPADPREVRLAKSDPRSRAINRSSRASRFASFAEEVLRDLDPRGPLEQLAADQVIHHAWMLKASLEKQAARDRAEKSGPDAEPVTKGRIRPSELDRASRSMKEALETLDQLRARTQPRPPSPAAVSPIFRAFDDDVIFSNEWPVVPCSDDLDDTPEVSDDSNDEVPSWEDRLVFDFEVSESSPVVKGTWITVAHVVSLIVDGWAWSGILRTHPELTEDDIRTCVAYAMSEENSA